MNRAVTASLAARLSLWLVGLMWLAPFLVGHHSPPIASFYSELVAAMLGLAALTLFVRQRYWQDMELPRMALVPLGLLGLLVVQLAFTDKVAFPAQGFMAALYLLWAVFLMMLAVVLRREIGLERMAVVLARFVLVGGVLSACIGILQHYQVHSLLDPLVAPKAGPQIYGNLAQTNHFADYTGLALASLLFLLAGRHWPRLGLLAALPVLLFVLALSGSRSSWLYLAAFAALSFWIYRQSRTGEGKILLAVSLSLLPGFALMQVLAHLPWLSAATPALTATDRLFDSVSGSSIRLGLWQEAWQMFLAEPWLGVGFGQLPWRYFLRNDMPLPGSLVNNAHNLVLHLLAEMGVFAALLLVVGAVRWLLPQARRKMELAEWWLLALLSTLAIHSLLEYPLWYFNFLGVAAILLGAGEHSGIRLDLKRTGRMVFVLALVLGWMSAFNLALSYRSLEGLLFTRYHYAPREQEEQALFQGLQKIHQESLLTPYIELAYSGVIALDKERLADKLELNGRAMRFAPTGPVVYRQAFLLALNGEDQAALQQWRRAASAYPGDLKNNAAELRRLAQADSASFARLSAAVKD